MVTPDIFQLTVAVWPLAHGRRAPGGGGPAGGGAGRPVLRLRAWTHPRCDTSADGSLPGVGCP